MTRKILSVGSCLVVVLLGMFLSPGVPAADAQRTTTSPLISVQELKAISSQADLCVLEVARNKKDFDDGHIPGAQFVDWLENITNRNKPERYNLADQKTVEELLSRLGATSKTRIVIYDRLSSRLAIRMYWTLKYYGHPRIEILDGGFSLWKSKFPLTKDVTTKAATNYKIKAAHPKLRTNMRVISEKLNDPNMKLIDGRPVEQFTGGKSGVVFHTGKKHKRKGHIPGAVNVFWKSNFNADGTFKSKKQLQALYASHGITKKNTVVTYCNEGLHATPPWFVLQELLGHKSVSVYDDSLSEWANSDKPMEMGESK